MLAGGSSFIRVKHGTLGVLRLGRSEALKSPFLFRFYNYW